jgi:hypothetical protein
MWYIIAIIIASSGLILGFISCSSGITRITDNIDTSQSINPMDSIKKQLTREEILQKLALLAQKKVPDELNQGAMCYKVAAIPNRAEYICPVCGHKTLYNDDKAVFINNDLPVCRSIAPTLVEIDCKLDESQFCKKCHPEVTGEPDLCITTHYKGEEKENRACGITREDMVLLQEFFSGKVTHSDDYDYETPLKDKMEKIFNLLGIDLKSK